VRFAVLPLRGNYSETGHRGAGADAFRAPATRLDHLYQAVSRIASSRSIGRVLVAVDAGFTTPHIAGLEEIRSLLRKLVAAGKELWFHADDYSDELLYLASACTRRVIHPMGSLRCSGFHRNALFFKRLLDTYGVQIQVIRRGRFKSAYDRFRLEGMDPDNRIQYEEWLRSASGVVHDTIARSTPPGGEALDGLLSGSLLGADEAVDAGWVDQAFTREGLLREWTSGGVRRSRVRVPRATGHGRKVAVLVLEGLIIRGSGPARRLPGPHVESSRFVPLVDRLARDRSVAAVVLRVNSGGGDAAASEDIREALVRLNEKKPLIVSMGPVAGSGGYLVATAGREIIAHPTTLTGSVGVIALFPAFGEALGRIGVTHATVKTHNHADDRSGLRPLSDSELRQFDAHVESVYRRFVTVVAEARGTSHESVHAVAEGRVWSGAAAAANGLVDATGDLDTAIARAMEAGRVRRAKILFFPVTRRSFLERQLARALPFGSISAAGFPLPAAHEALRVARGLSALVGRPLLMQPEVLDSLLGLHNGGIELLDTDLEIE
jgi:protease-4